MNWQKSRMQWVTEGDANSTFFHNVMRNRQRRNAIHMVHVDGVLVEGVQNIRSTVFTHFAQHYRASEVVRPTMDGLSFRKLSHA